MNFYEEILRTKKIRGPKGAPVACDSIFGWIISGTCLEENPTSIRTFHLTINEDLQIIQKFWETEEPPKARILTKEEKICEKHFVETYHRDVNGRFVVKIPFNEKRTLLGYSRQAAVRRLLSVERRLNRLPHLKQQYSEFIQEFLALGHMEEVPFPECQDTPPATYYLPHHFVTNESSSTTKLRVVFDGSSKTSSGVSLNDTMYTGATLQDDLFDILLRFREHPIVIKADITKMFRQFQLTTEDSNLHRILWREGPEHPIRDYRLKTITYGTASATYLSTRCLQQLALDVKERCPEASKALLSSMYVDDLMQGTDSSESAIKLYHELNCAVAEAGLELRKWATNDPSVFECIPESLRETKAQSFDEEGSIKALGVQWQPNSDMFTFTQIEFSENRPLTMRNLLADIARVFDPLGFISCVTVRGKLIMQELWKLSLGWDDQVPDFISSVWEDYKNDLQLISKLMIPRYLSFSSATTYEIHAFCDASEKAINAVVYIRAIHPDGTVTVMFVTSKSQVAPIKQVSLPRLELNGAVLVSVLVFRVRECMNLNCEIFLWCDSTIVLRWIAASPRRWQTYVANRVAKIQDLTEVESWRHVPGVQNPADLGSRGVSTADLLTSSFWWKGPEWLATANLPLFTPPASTNENLEERKTATLVHHVQLDTSLLTRYSSLLKLQRVTAYVFRFVQNCKLKDKTERNIDPLTPTELRAALTVWVKIVQQQFFQEDILSLNKISHVKLTSNLRKLFPYLDSNGVLRVSGRLENSKLPENAKHQMILPSDSYLTVLIIRSIHYNNFHCGFQLTCSTLLSQFWVLRGRVKIRHIIRSCVKCRRHRSKVAEQLMGNLPSSRVTPSRPFLHTGVDFAGPFTLKNFVGRPPKTYKGYLCIFVCMVTKAVHIEAVSSLTTEAFIATLRRFVSRRGLCSDIYSDCGTNFVGADRELKSLLCARSTNNAVADQLSSEGIRWHFNPPASPHRGGLWEAAVKSAKFHLRRVVSNSVLTYEQFSTLLAQIEAIMNSRPLYPASSDPGDLTALTPGHFLIGDSLRALPDEPLQTVKFSRLSVYQQQQQRLQHFWMRWSREYLNTLQQKHKWYWEKNNVKPDDLVLLVEDCAPGSWKMGRVIATHPGSDGKVRVVTVKTEKSTFERSIVKLVPLFNDE